MCFASFPRPVIHQKRVPRACCVIFHANQGLRALSLPLPFSRYVTSLLIVRLGACFVWKEQSFPVCCEVNAPVFSCSLFLLLFDLYSALMECLVVPLQDKLEEWKKTAIILDKEHAKGFFSTFSFFFQINLLAIKRNLATLSKIFRSIRAFFKYEMLKERPRVVNIHWTNCSASKSRSSTQITERCVITRKSFRKGERELALEMLTRRKSLAHFSRTSKNQWETLLKERKIVKWW